MSEPSDLQPWEEGLKRVDPGVHDLTAAHVHINVEGRVPLSFVAQFPPEGRRQAKRHTSATLSTGNLSSTREQFIKIEDCLNICKYLGWALCLHEAANHTE